MDNVEELVKRVIRDDLGKILSEELEIRLAPFLRIAKETRDGVDEVKEQIREDRIKIDKIEISQAKSEKQNSVIIDNQNNQETQMVDAVKKEASKISTITEKSVEKMFDKRPFLKRLVDKFKKK